ncbi:MAG: undecaprenyl-phosphate glucose phosphotransferase [Rhodothermales bacterium]
MIQEQSRFYQRLLFFCDATLIVIGWISAYYIRFELLIPPEWLPLSRYLSFLPWVLVITMMVFTFSGLYAPDRAQRLTRLIFSVAKAVGIGLLFVAASLSFYRELYFSRLHMILFGVIMSSLMIILRIFTFYALYRARVSGRNLRRVLIIGAGKAGRQLRASFTQYPWMGLEVVGFLDDEQSLGDEILGDTQSALQIVDDFAEKNTPIDYVYIALPLSAIEKVTQIVDELSKRLTHVCLVPDLFQFNLLNSRITDVDGLPVLHILDEAPMEYRHFVKRGIDIIFSSLFLLVISPILLLIAIVVKLSSKGPVFYQQERMGLNGQRFNILKFRTMPMDSEDKTGPVWAKSGEKRATKAGAFLRKTSLDELPQFFNVLKGDMSVVGPRPERPVFIENFKQHVPRYMLRHKVKAGITGWAQINGWRGNTSIEKRIEYDLYYIQNWSIRLDLKIMWLTLWKGFLSDNAY